MATEKQYTIGITKQNFHHGTFFLPAWIFPFFPFVFTPHMLEHKRWRGCTTMIEDQYFTLVKWLWIGWILVYTRRTDMGILKLTKPNQQNSRTCGCILFCMQRYFFLNFKQPFSLQHDVDLLLLFGIRHWFWRVLYIFYASAFGLAVANIDVGSRMERNKTFCLVSFKLPARWKCWDDSKWRKISVELFIW